MSNASGEFFAELEFTFLGAPSLRNSVKTSDGEIVRLDKKLWDASPILKKHAEKGFSYFLISACQRTVEALLEAHRHGTFPSDLESLLNVLDAASELELRELTSRCAATLLGTREFSECDYPEQCSTRTVMQCFKTILDSPFRTAEIYKKQLARIAKHSNNSADVMFNAINSLKQRVDQFLEINLESLPVDFSQCIVPVAIYNRAGQTQTAVYDGNYLIPVDLVGKNFSLGTCKIEESFYIKYGSYMLFKSGASIHRKDLRTDAGITEIAKECTHLLTRGNFVFAVQAKTGYHTVWLWVDDSKFVRVLMTPKKIQLIDFDCDSRMLAVKLFPNLIRLYRLSADRNLILLEAKEISQVTGMLLLRQRMYLTVELPDEKAGENTCMLKAYPISSLDDPELEVPFGEGHVTMKRAGNVLFLDNAGSLQVIEGVPPQHKLRTLSTVEEAPVLTELLMSL